MRAALLRALNEPLEVRDDVVAVHPGPGEVLVRIRATGVCHSDLSAINGTLPSGLPAVLGHEGAGEIVAVGDGVTNVAVGDHVIVAWTPPCGQCFHCIRNEAHLCLDIMAVSSGAQRFRCGDEGVHGMAGTGTFAEQVTLPWQAVVKIADDVPFDVASLIGCGVMTGVGAAINTAKVRPGSSVVVFGCGGVGMSIIQGARIAGASEIVAVDMVDSKLDQAKRFGATHGTRPDGLADLTAEVTAGRGFDYAFEAIGNPVTIRAAYDAARRGGSAIIVGVGRFDQTVEFNAFELFFNEKILRGSVYGSGDVRRDFDRLIRLWRSGQLDLEGMITHRIELDDINAAFEAMQRGEVIRQVIEFG